MHHHSYSVDISKQITRSGIILKKILSEVIIYRGIKIRQEWWWEWWWSSNSVLLKNIALYQSVHLFSLFIS